MGWISSFVPKLFKKTIPQFINTVPGVGSLSRCVIASHHKKCQLFVMSPLTDCRGAKPETRCPPLSAVWSLIVSGIFIQGKADAVIEPHIYSNHP